MNLFASFHKKTETQIAQKEVEKISETLFYLELAYNEYHSHYYEEINDKVFVLKPSKGNGRYGFKNSDNDRMLDEIQMANYILLDKLGTLEYSLKTLELADKGIKIGICLNLNDEQQKIKARRDNILKRNLLGKTFEAIKELRDFESINRLKQEVVVERYTFKYSKFFENVMRNNTIKSYKLHSKKTEKAQEAVETKIVASLDELNLEFICNATKFPEHSEKCYDPITGCKIFHDPDVKKYLTDERIKMYEEKIKEYTYMEPLNNIDCDGIDSSEQSEKEKVTSVQKEYTQYIPNNALQMPGNMILS